MSIFQRQQPQAAPASLATFVFKTVAKGADVRPLTLERLKTFQVDAVTLKRCDLNGDGQISQAELTKRLARLPESARRTLAKMMTQDDRAFGLLLGSSGAMLLPVFIESLTFFAPVGIFLGACGIIGAFWMRTSSLEAMGIVRAAGRAQPGDAAP